ncbi:hypothetical protein ANTPLA_LOCUS7916 [Anthophora plagiata]
MSVHRSGKRLFDFFKTAVKLPGRQRAGETMKQAWETFETVKDEIQPERPIKEDNKSSEKDMSKHDSGTMSRPIIHWLKPNAKQLMRSAYRRVRGDHSRWTSIIIRQRLRIGETSVGVAR